MGKRCHRTCSTNRARRSQRTSNLFEQHAHGSENHRRAERESRVDGEEFHGHHFAYSASIQSDGLPCIIV